MPGHHFDERSHDRQVLWTDHILRTDAPDFAHFLHTPRHSREGGGEGGHQLDPAKRTSQISQDPTYEKVERLRLNGPFSQICSASFLCVFGHIRVGQKLQ